MGSSCRGNPGLTAVIGEEAILFAYRITGEVAADDDQVLAAMEGIVIFDCDGVGAGGGFALEDGQVDRFDRGRKTGRLGRR